MVEEAHPVKPHLKRAIAISLTGAGVFLLAFLYAMTIVPLDATIDIRESFMTVGGMALGIGMTGYAWAGFLLQWVRRRRDRRTLEKYADSDSAPTANRSDTPYYGKPRKRRKGPKAAGATKGTSSPRGRKPSKS